MHKHGYEYRAVITAADGTKEYSEWFNNVDRLQQALRRTRRDVKKQYQCQQRAVRCIDACDVNQTIEIVAKL